MSVAAFSGLSAGGDQKSARNGMSTVAATLRDLAALELVSSRNARKGIGIGAFIAATALGAQIVVPWIPVPMTLQPLFVLLAGLLLGGRLGAMAMVGYLALGVSGAPVFSAGGAGLPWLLGPTGGYLLAFPAAALVAGGLAGGPGSGILRLAGASMAGLSVIYLGGTAQLVVLTGLPWGEALAVGMAPFLFGDAMKIGVAAALASRLRPRALHRF